MFLTCRHGSQGFDFYNNFINLKYFSFRFNEMPSEQTEALIGINSEHEA